jgi:hypothetical protein
MQTLRSHTTKIIRQYHKQCEHVVFFNLGDLTQEQEQELSSIIHNMKEKIDGVIDINIGKSFTTERSNGFTHGLRVRFDSKERLKDYTPHEAHQKLIAFNKGKHKAPPMCLDWEV